MKHPNPSDQGPWQPRFSVGLLLLVTFVFSVMGAAGFYLVQSLKSGGNFRLIFILFTVASPLLLLVVVSGARRIFVWARQRY